MDVELTLPTTNKNEITLTFEPGRKHPHQTGEGTLRIRATNGDETYECEVPMKRVENA